MDPADTRRRLLWHAVLVIILSLAEGMLIPLFANPRMGLSAHTGGIMTGLLTALFGFAWLDLQLSPGAARALFWLIVFETYGNLVALVLAAAFATRDATPIHGGAVPAAAWQETLVTGTFVVVAVATFVCCVMVLYGLRRPSPNRRAGF